MAYKLWATVVRQYIETWGRKGQLKNTYKCFLKYGQVVSISLCLEYYQTGTKSDKEDESDNLVCN